MNCKEFRKRLAEESRVSDPGNFQAHASSCPECARMLDDERLVEAALGLLRQAAATEQPSPAIERQLLGEFRNRQHSRNTDLPRSTFCATWPWLAAAAAAVIIAGVLVWQLSRPAAETPMAIGSTSPAAAGAPPSSSPLAEKHNVEEPAAGKSMTHRVLAPPAQSASRLTEIRAASPGRESSVVAPLTAQSKRAAASRRQPRLAEGTEFFPTMQLAADEPFTELQLVRVRVSRKTLEGFGLSLDPRMADRPVKADLLIGPDGLTRAVRFISERE